MPPFMDLAGLTPRPGRLKSVWVRGADGLLESVWVPDWELEAETLGLDAAAAVSG
ncbi:MAG TPA: hypothetical protein VEG38_08120 [Acidimicrobiia bacterium]|nr:hypothetical protein [Acidimicrobiia bacterium]